MSVLLSTIGKAEKNKLYTDSAFKFLLQIHLSDPVYLCYNTEEITWRGHTWLPFPIKLGDTNEDSTGSDPDLTLRVDNVSRSLQSALESSGGGVGTKVTFFVVNTKNLSDTEPEYDEEYVVKNTQADQNFIDFTLGNEYSSRTRRPLDRYMKDFCRYKFKGIQCGYCGSLTTCNKTLTDCRTRNNSARFGGFIGIDQSGIYM